MAVSVRSAAPPWAYSGLIWNFTVRDVKSRFKGTLLGWLWSLLVPLATVLIYSVVFSLIFRAVPPPLADGSPGNYTVWLLTGLVVWTGFSSTLNTGVMSLLSSGPLLQKIYFPSYAPVIGSVLGSLMQTGIELGIVLTILLIIGNVGVAWLLIPVWAVLFVVFVGAITYVVAALNVYYRDLGYLLTVALQLLFFLTPVIYPITLAPESWNGIPVRTILEANPVGQFIEMFRALVYSIQVPGWSAWGWLLLWTVVVVALAALTYDRRGRDVGEAV